MVSLAILEENKISTDFSGYPVVFMGETGDGKTDSLNRYLRSVAPEGKVPLFVMFEDRHKAITNLMAQRVYSIPDVLSVISQLKDPNIRKRFSGVVFDTIDKFEEMASRYTATNKEVDIIEDLTFGKGKRYLNGIIGMVSEIRNMGLPVHFVAQCYRNENIVTKEVVVQSKLKDVTKAQIFHEAFLVGMVKMDEKAKNPVQSDRYITFKKTKENVELKDGFGGLPEKMYVKDLKTNLEKIFSERYDSSQIVSTQVLEEIVEVETFESVKEKGLELGSKLADTGHLDEAMNILKVHLGEKDDGTVRMFNDLVESQIDLAKVVVMKLQEVADKYKI